MTIAPPRFCPPRQFENGAEWLRALGSVPLERVIFDPWPGTATEADLLRFVERDKRLCELIDGTLVEKPVGFFDAIIASNLIVALGGYVTRKGLGVVSGPDTTLRMASSGRLRLPDVAFISLNRLPKTRERVPTLAPDLAVEVLSDSNTNDEIEPKLLEYFESGTRLAWVIDPSTRTVAIHRSAGPPSAMLDDTGILDGEQDVPGFTMNVADLFLNVPQVK